MVSKYFTGKEILKRKKITSFELFEYVRNGLKPYTKIGRIFECPDHNNLKMRLDAINSWIEALQHPDYPKNLGSWDKERVNANSGRAMFLYELEQDKVVISKKMEKLSLKSEKESNWSWYYCDLPYSDKEAERIVDNVVNSYFKKDDVSKIIVSKKKLSPCQRHKESCRRVAEEIWEKEPTLTIVAMCKRPEIIDACEGIIYKGKHTIRNWVNDLCPNRKKGRRKGT